MTALMPYARAIALAIVVAVACLAFRMPWQIDTTTDTRPGILFPLALLACGTLGAALAIILA